jgi:hypothetical protein
MTNPSNSAVQNLLPVQAYFNLDGSFNTFIGQGVPFYATANPSQSGLNITNSTINSTTIGATTPSTGVFTNIATTTGTIATAASGPTDIVNKQYVDYFAAGLSWKAPALTATSANITLSGLQTINGVTLVAGDVVLVKNQGTASENGIYVASAGPWTYSVGGDTWSEYVGAIIFIASGSLNGTAWYCTAQPGGTLGVTAMNWSNFSVASSYTAGTGLTLTGTVFSITNTGVSAATYGSATASAVIAVNAQGQITSASSSTITPAVGSITGFGTGVATALAVNTGSTGSFVVDGGALGTPSSGTLTNCTFPTLNQNTTGTAGGLSATLAITSGGTGQITASAAFNALSPITTIGDLIIGNGTNSATRLGIGANATVLTSNGTTASWAALPAGMVYPGAGIANSTGTAWGTSYSTTGSGNVVLATGATQANPTISNYENFTPTTAPTYSEGRVWYDSTEKALAYYNDSSAIAVHISQDLIFKVINNTGSTIPNGSPVYVTGTSSGQTYPNVALARADVAATSAVIGLTNGAIANGAIGYVTSQGTIDNVNTGSFTVGQVLYLSPYSAGQLMNTIPPTGITVQVGVATYIDSSAGHIYVKQTTPLAVPASIITGVVAVANGGTGLSSVGTNGNVLTSNGSAWVSQALPASGITITDDTTTNATRYLAFTSATSGSITGQNVASTKLQFNPSTGILTATGFSGSGASLTSLSATNISSGTLAVANGGTGQTSYTNGQLLIGNTTGNTLTKATLTAGDGISVTNGTGSITINNTSAPYSASYVVIAGGAAAGGNAGGGGGAGGYLSGTSNLLPSQTYSFVVGSGGTGTTTTIGGSGTSSTALGLTAIGGGGGGQFNTSGGAGASGGSGGGSAQGAAAGSGTSGQGNNGGGSAGYPGAGGGGGGASAAGSANSSSNGGAGGAGTASSITGSSVTRAGGGGGYGENRTGGTGGAGGAGGGGTGAASNGGGGGNGTANTGSGGGGGGIYSGKGGNGGSGVVIISVPTAKYTGTTTGSPTVTTSGSNTIMTFTSSGSYTA